ncbi:cyclin-dependent kinase 9 [Pancytospora philotis]|nr:cyclin-dependent kinase 9 [Pancytospora philotis]
MFVGRSNSARFSSTKFPYSDLVRIGNGTFGEVFSAAHHEHRYAVKKYTFSDTPIHTTTLREIKALRALSHPNVIRLVKVVVHEDRIWTVFPLCDVDLCALVRARSLALAECRCIMRGILRGLQHIHSSGYLHRDLKTSNVLVDYSEQPARHEEYRNKRTPPLLGQPARDEHGPVACTAAVKICDFGMAKQMQGCMTPGVVTLWYRAPELLLGSTQYDSSIDVWSAGCILYEMARREPLFKAESEMEMLALINRVCGTISPESMPGLEAYPHFASFTFAPARRTLGEDCEKLDPDLVDLIDRMVVLDPKRRLSVEECLAHPFLAS